MKSTFKSLPGIFSLKVVLPFSVIFLIFIFPPFSLSRRPIVLLVPPLEQLFGADEATDTLIYLNLT